MKWLQYLRKEGGLKYLIQSLLKGTLFISVLNFLFLGRDKKALEILRLSSEYKLLKRLRKANVKNINQYLERKNIDFSIKNESNNELIKKIWICWWQGIDEAPFIVQQCYSSVQKNFKEWDIVVITLDNYKEYISFPEYIETKWKKGQITLTHMSDLLRVELLSKYGGLWIDSTVYVTSPYFPKSIGTANLFWFKTLKPGADGHVLNMSSWMLYANEKSQILKLTKFLLYEYWKTHNGLLDYFLVHYMMAIASEVFPYECKEIPSFSNSLPHILLLNLFEKYNEKYWEDLCRMTSFHKLSYKLSEEKIRKAKGSYYDKIFRNNNESYK